jgi:hypothetical protein
MSDAIKADIAMALNANSTRPNMKRYEPSVPRGALGLAAAAMTTITMVSLVALPAKLESQGIGSLPLAVEKAPVVPVGHAAAQPSQPQEPARAKVARETT